MPRIGAEFLRVNDAMTRLAKLVAEAHMLVDQLEEFTLHLPELTTPSRALNTNFVPHPTRPVLGFYGVQLAATSTLVGGQDMLIRLLSNAGTPTQERCRGFLSLTQALGVNANLQSQQAVSLSYLIPAGHTVRLARTGTGTGALVTTTEIIF